MFPSNNNTNNYLHPSFSPTYLNQSSSSSSFGNGGDTNFFLQHYHHNNYFTPGQFLLACVPETTPTMTTTSSDIDGTMPERQVRKDRHSKIYTAHGLRDRRVRLSIGIARQFFDLQDLLGFDKASNTIEWLLIKSRKAIRKLVESKESSTGGHLNPSCSADSDLEMFSESDEDIEEGSDQIGLVLKSKSVVEASREEMNETQKATMEFLAKASRAKARARAKERTREKIYTRKLKEFKDSPEHFFNQARTSSAERLKAVSEVGNSMCMSNSRTNNQFPIADSGLEESIVIARKIKPTPNLNYHQNWMLSKDLNSKSYLSCMPQNWDVNGATVRPSFAALSSMNPSGDHQNYGKPWEVHNNGHLEQ